MNPEHILAMFLTGLVGLFAYHLVEIIRESKAEDDARIHRNMREMWQRLEEDRRRDIEEFNLTQLEAKLDELRQKRDQIILDALSKAEKEKRKKDDELTGIAQKCEPTLRFDDPIYAVSQLTEQERQLFYDSLAQELREYELVQDEEEEGGHGHMTFLEKAKQDHPDKSEAAIIGCYCPCDFGYGPPERREVGRCPRGEFCLCGDCWNREMPEPEKQRPEDSVDALTYAAKIFPNFKICENYTAVKLKDKDDDFARFGPHSKNPYGKDDPVNHPSHYTAGKIEVIDCIESMIAPIKDPEQAFLAGQVLKYIARYSLKNGVEDLKKSKWYLERLIGKVGKE